MKKFVIPVDVERYYTVIGVSLMVIHGLCRPSKRATLRMNAPFSVFTLTSAGFSEKIG